ncbi:hypothetical protein VaNZ11_016361 [Volvox africanus]|uniref:Sulfotransferase n=1 Tax=Volvox africanus TaxID=51714 RepID=A0ABQ5SNX6_9CHLO|nr:hypothetical protein VaNZ11_016361 [Volvox africanus]
MSCVMVLLLNMLIEALVIFALAASLTAGPVASLGQGLGHRSLIANSVTGELSADDPARNGKDYWERLVGTPSRLARLVKKEGILPASKYSMETFDLLPFQEWLREYSLLPNTSHFSYASIPPPPLSFVCGVWINPTYKFIFIRNRKTASSTFITAVKRFMLDNGMCNITRDGVASNNCIMRLEPGEVRRAGGDLNKMWKDYLVITSTRNPFARAASGYQFTYDKWNRHDSVACKQPSFRQFCKDPFIMGKISNLFNCVEGQRDGVGPRHEGHWNFDFCHVEPAAPCMVDDAGKLVVDFVIRYERLEEDMQAALELINVHRPVGTPPLTIPQSIKWRNKGTTAKNYDINSTDAAAFVYAHRYRSCGAPCVEGLADFFARDLKLFGWDRPGPAPPVSTPSSSSSL